MFVEGEEIVTTPAHPFYSPVKGWINALHLRAGDNLVLVNGKHVVIENVQHEILETPVTVYNFEVQDLHTYFVGQVSILVHNTCALDDVLQDATDTTRIKGNTRNYEKMGGYDQALADFNKLNQTTPPRTIPTKYGDGLLGSHNGSNLILRRGSKTGGVTLELQISSRNTIKIRYLEVV